MARALARIDRGIPGPVSDTPLTELRRFDEWSLA